VADATHTRALVGRTREMTQIAQLLARVSLKGDGLVVRGGAGIGKTALLEFAEDRARQLGMRVLSVYGAQSEANLQFAGLHRLVRPLLDSAARLPARQRDALLGAFGIADVSIPDLFLIGLATLELISVAATRQPLLVLVDDAHWLDDATCAVIAFFARRLETEQVALVSVVRDGYDNALVESGLGDITLDGLDAAEAAELLDRRTPGLDPEIRRRVLQYAAGNPLALVELPAAFNLPELERVDALSVLPLTSRLEQAFADRAKQLPDETRTLLLVAAINDGDELGELLLAASVLTGQRLSPEVAEPALDAYLISVDRSRVLFHHPLVRSALYHQASEPQRRAAHLALAQSIAGQPSRRVWHRARAVVGFDEGIAAEMVQVAARARRLGAIRAAISAEERAAELTREPRLRATRLLLAAEMAFESGSSELVERLLTQAERLGLGLADQRRATWVREMFQDGTAGDASRIRLLVDEAKRAAAEGQLDVSLKLVLGAALRSWWAEAGTDATQQIVEAATALEVDDDDPRLLVIFAVTAPRERGESILRALARARVAEFDDPDALRLFGMAARALGEFEYAVGFLGEAASGLRSQGRLSLLAQALCMQAHAAIEVGNFELVLTAADESRRLSEETSQPIWTAGALTAEGTVAALRGELDQAEMLADDAERIVLPGRVSNLLAVVQSLRTTTALSAGRYEDAFSHVCRLFDPSDISYHQRELFSAVSYMAEAAVHCGRRDDAVAMLDGVGTLAALTPSPQLQLGIAFARAVLADDAEAEPLYRSAFAATSGRAPLHEARLNLVFGQWLRRQRRVQESRGPLRAARDFFELHGFAPWAERARQELRASGEASGGNRVNPRARLSPQELQIARMAAEGMTNQEIGQRLFLSHRTVGSHLYRIFPKLGVTSRWQLKDALEGEPR
jgi:DNA-binding CsgD family transcriptional regulator